MDQNSFTQTFERFSAALDSFPGFPEKKALRENLHALGKRAWSKPADLACIMLFGPTGAGKSKLCNSLYRRSLTPTGFRRPTTRTPHVIVPDERRQEVIDGLPVLPFETVDGGETAFSRLVLIDAPDIDSVCEENREIADAFIQYSDALVVVLTPSKYADESIWSYIRSFHRQQLTFCIVLNKTTDSPIHDDLKEKLTAEDIAVPVFTIPFHPSDDGTLLPDSPGFAEFRNTIGSWCSSGALHRRAMQRSAAACSGLMDASALPWLTERREILDRTLTSVRERIKTKEDALEQGLPFQVDKQTLSGIYSNMIRHLERIDPLRVPRRFLSYPFRLVSSKLKSMFQRSETQPKEELDKIWDINEEAFVNESMDLVQELTTLIEKAEKKPPADRTEAALRQRFTAFQEHFQKWLKSEAEQAAQHLSPGQRVRFYIAQVLVFGTVLGLEIQTGGLITLTEMVTDGLVSPFAAKLIGMALSSDESRKVQEKAHREYMNGAGNVLTQFAEPYVAVLQDELEAVEQAAAHGRDLSTGIRHLEAHA